MGNDNHIAVSHTLLDSMNHNRSRGRYSEQNGSGPSLLQVLRFRLPVLMPPTALHPFTTLIATVCSPGTDSIVK
jgi:hypothetical protein